MPKELPVWVMLGEGCGIGQSRSSSLGGCSRDTEEFWTISFSTPYFFLSCKIKWLAPEKGASFHTGPWNPGGLLFNGQHSTFCRSDSGQRIELTGFYLFIYCSTVSQVSCYLILSTSPKEGGFDHSHFSDETIEASVSHKESS
jgi:hypothetical protein